MGGDSGDLRTAQREPTAVESSPQGKADLLCPVPRCHQGTALVRQERQPLSLRRGLSAELDQQRNSASARALIHLIGELLVSDGPYTEGFGGSSSPRPQLGCDHRGA